MAIFTGNVDLLVSAPILQDALVDKDGTPMSGGTITCYHDNSRTTLKNWYYQSSNFADSSGQYTYSTLPNPLTLSAAGTICDVNGNDTLPFFYPFDELDAEEPDAYYITIINYAKTNQITRPNFPFTGDSAGSASKINTFNNLVINNGFWRNIQPNTLGITPFTTYTYNTGSTTAMTIPTGGTNYAVVVAPSQHDGFRMPDIQFQKNNLTGNDSVTFTPFPLGFGQPILNSIVPEYYIAHTCTSAGNSETTKCYQFPISLHVNTLAGVPFTVSIEAQNSGAGTNTVSLFLLQDPGTGGTGGGRQQVGQVTLNSTWSSYSFTGIFPSTAGMNLGTGADDGWYFQVQMPLNVTCTVNFTKPSLYLTDNVVPSNNFQTYDQVDSIANSPRIGDLRISTNSFVPFGWVPMNDGVIGLNAMSVVNTSTQVGYARANADTFKLFNHIWNMAQQFDTGSNFNPVCQMYTNSGSTLAFTNYGANPYADFTANKAIQLTKMFGRALMGTVPVGNLLSGYGRQSVGVTLSNNAGNILFTAVSGIGLYQGAPISFRISSGGSYPSTIIPNFIYFITNISGTTFNVTLNYENAITGTGLVAFGTAGSNLFINFNQTGATLGEYGHTQQISELVNHNHPGSTIQVGSGGGGSLPTAANITATTTNGVTVAPQGGGQPFNITEPGVFYNLFIKQ